MSAELRVFIAYSRDNNNERVQLQNHLSPMIHEKLIDAWHDGKIEPGQDWDKEIRQKLDRADIVLLLISASFIASSYCYSIEMKKALDRHNRKECKVIPIIISPCDWTDTPIGGLQALPKDGKPVFSENWQFPDSAYLNIVQELRKIIKEDIEGRKKIIQEKEDLLSKYKEKISALEKRCKDLEGYESILNNQIDKLGKLKAKGMENTIFFPLIKKNINDLREKLLFIFEATSHIETRLERQRQKDFAHDRPVTVEQSLRQKFGCTQLNDLKRKVDQAKKEVQEDLENWESNWISNKPLDTNNDIQRSLILPKIHVKR